MASVEKHLPSSQGFLGVIAILLVQTIRERKAKYQKNGWRLSYFTEAGTIV
jgi:hypothetical protein